MRKLISILLAALVMACGLGAATPTPASAEPAWYTKVRKVVDAKWIKVGSSLCMRVEVKANVRISFQRWVDFDPGPHRYDLFKYANPRIESPVATIRMFKKCNFDYPKSNDGITSVKISQFFSMATPAFCRLNPSLSVGYPWGVSVGIAPTCESASSKSIGTPDPQPVAHKGSTYKDAYKGKIGGWPDASGAVYEDESTTLCLFPSSNVTLVKPGKNLTYTKVNGGGNECIGLVRLAQS